MNLPVTSVRDITIHDDDLVIATHGRSFWILDDITPLRQMSSQSTGNAIVLFQPATAVRIDNDVFLGSPLPPEEPAAKNPPDGAIIDYYLPSPAKTVKLEIFDSTGKTGAPSLEPARKRSSRIRRWRLRSAGFRSRVALKHRGCIASCGTCVGAVPANAE